MDSEAGERGSGGETLMRDVRRVGDRMVVDRKGKALPSGMAMNLAATGWLA